MKVKGRQLALPSVYGDEIPVTETAVFVGRGRIRPFGVWLPARFVFVHNAGRDYRHYIEATFFGLPFLKVNEGYLDGESFFESPMGTFHNDPNTNQGANLAVWAEAGWFPSIWLTDSRVRWEAVDENTALLFVPFEDQVENFVVRFNPQTGLIDTMEAMRYREAGEGKSKILWITRNEPGNTLPDMKISVRIRYLAGPGKSLGILHTGRSSIQRRCKGIHSRPRPVRF